tara:strand:+ start:5186 stop:5473 length:288 start_codon:yes stop_codon:yes gene_type:complete
MKSLIGHPIVIYVAAGLACLCIMVIVDYLLGTEAEHLNAWAIVNKLFGRDTGVGDSRSIQYLGLFGATLLMLIVNGLFGVLLIGFIKLLIGLVHA